ncbi:signal peptidase II [Pedobacter boryungensis]|uniref:Lipoprotein signal peptidase n=1 Tax=Pedobacter boryungensis TaxID=869962 RepID=A0ABX2DD40_9SPHI|nr:signal peptidase II [Pedobacter boryungensis]NQX32009.1 signal peptidase II [Pedobacter boryungensis]
MQKKNSLRLILLLAIVALNIGCDQVSKSIVRQKIDYDENISIIKNHFILTKVENTGAFLSAGNNLPEAVRIILLSILPVLVLGYGLFYLLNKNNLSREMQIGLCFLIGGGIGNVYDRIVFGSVTDFLHIDFGIFRTGIFNLADVSIMIGIAILFIQSLKKKTIKQTT